MTVKEFEAEIEKLVGAPQEDFPAAAWVMGCAEVLLKGGDPQSGRVGKSMLGLVLAMTRLADVAEDRPAQLAHGVARKAGTIADLAARLESEYKELTTLFDQATAALEAGE